MTRSLPLVAALGLLAAPSAHSAPADPAAKSPTLRFVESPESSELQSALVHLRHPESGAEIDLVGAVHVGDQGYYDGLNARFESYDAVLFELVGGDGDLKAKLAARPDANSPIRFFQILLKNSLGLEFQIDAIDYTPENFVHADMSAREFEESRQASGETLESVMARTLQAYIARGDSAEPGGDKATDLGMLMGVFTGGGDTNRLKLALARQLGDIDDVIEGIDGADGSVILAGRNAIALRKVEEILEGGKRRLAVFYGAGHLPGMEAAIKTGLGFERTGIEWVPAWTMDPPAGE
ncbi:hypothetical protein BH23VER1_BH23VER1_23230 [soil metagenome]